MEPDEPQLRAVRPRLKKNQTFFRFCLENEKGFAYLYHMNGTQTPNTMTPSQKTTHAEAGAYSYETILGDIKLTSQALRIYDRWFYTVWNEEGEVVCEGRCNTKQQAKDAPRVKALKMAGLW